MDHLEEQNLLKKAINGDKQAFSALLDEHYMMIYRTAYKWCGNQENAEDIAQNVCIKLGSSINSFRMDCRFSSWLYRITLNTAKDFYRKQKNHLDIDDVPIVSVAEGENPEQQAEFSELWKYVNKLPDKHRDAVLLVYGEDMNHSEVAEIMECAESTVSWYTHEAKKHLKEMMKDNGR